MIFYGSFSEQFNVNLKKKTLKIKSIHSSGTQTKTIKVLIMLEKTLLENHINQHFPRLKPTRILNN